MTRDIILSLCVYLPMCVYLFILLLGPSTTILPYPSLLSFPPEQSHSHHSRRIITPISISISITHLHVCQCCVSLLYLRLSASPHLFSLPFREIRVSILPRPSPPPPPPPTDTYSTLPRGVGLLRRTSLRIIHLVLVPSTYLR